MHNVKNPWIIWLAYPVHIGKADIYRHDANTSIMVENNTNKIAILLILICL